MSEKGTSETHIEVYTQKKEQPWAPHLKTDELEMLVTSVEKSKDRFFWGVGEFTTMQKHFLKKSTHMDLTKNKQLKGHTLCLLIRYIVRGKKLFVVLHHF